MHKMRFYIIFILHKLRIIIESPIDKQAQKVYNKKLKGGVYNVSGQN